MEDIRRLAEIDKKSYGESGATIEYFMENISRFPEGVLVVEEEGIITGFMVFEIYQPHEKPKNFPDMSIKSPFFGKWMFIIAFTTSTNYEDKKEDGKLLSSAEEIAKKRGCAEACVPLSIDHPFEKNGVFEFFEGNGYSKAGSINWNGSSPKIIECYLMRKKLM